MALPRSALSFVSTVTRHDGAMMTLLPPLTDDERERLAREQEDREQDERLRKLLATAMEAIAEAQRELRFPLNSVRVGDDDPR
jgi:predicted aminopeptidase